jgi:hypothetical protein
VAIVRRWIAMAGKLRRRTDVTAKDAVQGSDKKPAKKDRERVNIGVAIRTDLWRKLRALAITQGKLTGELLDNAIENYIEMFKKGDSPPS